MCKMRRRAPTRRSNRNHIGSFLPFPGIALLRQSLFSTYTITLPTGEQKESQLVTFPAGKAGQLVVIVYPDGTEKVVKKAVTENGQTKLLLDTNATVRFPRRKRYQLRFLLLPSRQCNGVGALLLILHNLKRLHLIIHSSTRDPESAVPVEEKLKVAFALTGLDGETWILTTCNCWHNQLISLLHLYPIIILSGHFR